MFHRLLWQSPQSLPLALAAALGSGLLLLWLYRSQLRMLPAPWVWIVPGLRFAAIAVMLAALLKPVVLRLRNPWEEGAIVILVDRSKSMSVVDGHRSPAQRIALADVIGTLPAGTRQLVSHELRTHAEDLRPLTEALAAARSELDYAKISGRGTEAAGQRLKRAADSIASAIATMRADALNRAKPGRFIAALDDLHSLISAGDSAGVDWIPHVRQRVEAVVNASGEFQTTADNELYQNDPQAKAAADAVIGQTRLDLSEGALRDPVVGLLANLPARTPVILCRAEPSLRPFALASKPTTAPVADGSESDLNGAIAAVSQKLVGQSVQAVVLLSDGRQVGGSGATPSLDVPLFTVGVAGTLRKDISIVRFDVPPTVFVGETATAHIELASTGLKDQAVEVTLDAQGKVQAQHITLSEGRTAITFPIKADAAGTMRVVVAIQGAPADATTANAQSERRIKVLSEKVDVAVISGSAGWDDQYLHNALQRTPWISCHDEIVRPNAGLLRMTAQEILNQEVVVLDDVDPAALRAEQWSAIGQLVTERGGGVIVIAGNAVSPQQLTTIPVMANLLPWPVAQPPSWQTWAGESPGYRLQPAAGQAADLLKLLNDPEEDRRRWAQLPPFFHILPVTKVKPNVRPLLLDSDSGQPVLTEARVGVGRAMFLGANETWRWRYKVGERDQDRFWLQLIREAGESPYANHAPSETGGTMAIDLDNINPKPGQPIQVRARVLDEQGRPQAKVSPAVRVENNGSQVMTIPLRPATPQVESGRYVVTIPGLGQGDYDVRLMLGSEPTKLIASLHVEPNYEAEMAEVSGDDANLRRMAEASGGEFLRLDQIRDLPEKLSAAREHRPQSIEYPLWDSPYLFLFVLGCLGGEWAMRKRFGLV